VVQPLFRAAADPDPEVAGLAVQTLTEMGEAGRKPVVEALGGADQNLRLAALRYLSVQADDPLCKEIPWDSMLGLPMVWVPPGPFLMGSDKNRDPQAYEDELPQHQVTLPGYWIGRYPVTVDQFRAFVESSRYEVGDKDSPLVKLGKEDHPVVYVTWHRALAYCRWLSENRGLSVTLPSEAEWEKAARGTDGRIYPWGDEPPDESRCNYGGKVGVRTPVGRYSPQGDSPYGCADMAGNGWEWTRSLWGKRLGEPDFKYPYDTEDGRENLEADDRVHRVVRGGAFDVGQRGVRCAYRGGGDPSFGDDLIGFRIVVAPGFSSGLW
jgi:formylglycine-generating enzyme required for sulfatase activity